MKNMLLRFSLKTLSLSTLCLNPFLWAKDVPKPKEVQPTSTLTIYFLPLHCSTLIPVTEDRIKIPGNGRVIASPEKVAFLTKLLSPPKIDAVHHAKEPAIDGTQIRVRVEMAKGEKLVFVDSSGVVSNAGTTFRLSRQADEQLDHFLTQLDSDTKAYQYTRRRIVL